MVDQNPGIQSEPFDGSASVREVLRHTHSQSAVAPLNAPSSEGIFPGAVWVQPRPVVADAMWLRNDIRYACLHRRRTVLVSAANEQLIRVFCAQHVVDEIIEHSVEWTTNAKRPLSHDDFMRHVRDEYLPVLRVVPDDGVPATWLSPPEIARLNTLTDRDDVPSVKLALAVHGLYLSRDKRALRAAYGDDAELVEHAEWLEHLKAGGDAGELSRMLNATGGLVFATGYGIVQAMRRSYEAIGPLSALAAGALGYAAWNWLRHPSRRGLAEGFGKLIEAFAEITEVQRSREQHFEAALPPIPTWEELAASNDPAAVVGRAALYALAREPSGQLSAQELAGRIDYSVTRSDKTVRAALRSTSCFGEVYRGRWQVGEAYSLALARGVDGGA